MLAIVSTLAYSSAT